MIENRNDSSIRVLLVEDSLLIAEHVGDALAQSSLTLQIKIAANQNDALAIAKNFRPEIVVLDLRLKDGTGFEVLKELSKTEIQPLFIVLTNYALPEYRKHAMQHGAKHFLDKSSDIGQLKSIIERFSESRMTGPTLA